MWVGLRRVNTGKTIDSVSNTVHADAIHKEVRNESGVTLLVGMAVAYSDYNVSSEIEVIRANNTTTNPAIGLVSEGSILNGTLGIITSTGVITGVDTDAISDAAGLTENSIAYVNGDGLLSMTQPTTGFMQPIAFVIKEGPGTNTGILQVLAAYPKQDASDVRNTPAGNITATTIQAAINELDTEKEPANANIQQHISDTTTNPHNVTASDVGVSATTSSVTVNGITFNKYVHIRIGCKT